jgi:hypothetical protein
VHVSKLVQHNEGGFHPDDIKFILELIHQMDPEVLFLPYNNNHKLSRTWNQMSVYTNYTSMLNIKSLPWGKASDNRNKAEMSFCIASDSISTVKHISSYQQMQDFLDATGIRMGYHALHQSNRKNVGFCLGKSVQHTHWTDLTTRLSEHITDSLRQMQYETKSPQGKKAVPLPVEICWCRFWPSRATSSISQVSRLGLLEVLTSPPTGSR